MNVERCGGTFQASADNPAAAMFTNMLVGASLLYTLLYDVLPEGTRLSIAGALGLAVVMRCLLSWTRPAAQASSFLLACMILIPAFNFVFVMAPGQHNFSDYAGVTLRLATCIGVLVYFSHERSSVSPTLALAICVSTFVVALYTAITGEPFEYAGILRPASFTGGEEAVHSSSYACAAALLGAASLWRAGRLRTRYFILLGLPLLGLVIAYQVRTTWVMVITFAFISLLIHWRTRGRNISSLLLMAAIAGLSLAAFSLTSDVDVTEVSSGRTAVYQERLTLLAQRPPVELLIGTGPGSEVLPSDIWWWAPKNSHNDFIDIAIQIGLIGLGLLICLVVVTLRVSDEMRMPLLSAFVVSSLVSNGLLTRPWVAVLFLTFVLVRPIDERRG